MNRCRFLTVAPVLPTVAVAGQPPADGWSDPPRDLPATGGDLGTLADEVERVAASSRYSLRFPSPQYRTHAEYRATARAAVLDHLGYEPEADAFVDRKRCGIAR
jgi:hypothetical protein